jgi:uncharacterized protein (TIGR04255 family)
MSNDMPHFAKAPIVEALIGLDLQEKLPDSSLPLFAEMASHLGAEYTIREDIMLGEFKVEIGKPVDQSQSQLGYFVRSPDRLKVAHLRRDNFSLSRLAPYSDWGEFRDEAFRLWLIYRSEVGPVPLSIFRVRYINKLSWPAKSQMETYLKFYPHIPPGLPQTINGCFLQASYPLSKPYQGQFIQRLYAAPNQDSSQASFVLDHELAFSAVGLSDSQIWSGIDECRSLKNDYFRASITPEMEALIA